MRSLVLDFDCDPDLKPYLQEWGERVARHPDVGYAVPGAPDYLGLPLRTDRGSFLVIYWYDDEAVYCVGLRRVPSGVYGEIE